jgi:hypothetical protein
VCTRIKHTYKADAISLGKSSLAFFSMASITEIHEKIEEIIGEQ